MEPSQVAAILQRAANLRPDVRKAVVRSPEDDPTLLVVNATFYTPGRRLERETRVAGVLDGRTIRAILDDWLGNDAASNGPRNREAEALRDERNSLFAVTPEQALGMHRDKLQNPRPPSSKLQWPATHPTNPDGSNVGSVGGVPAEPREADGDPATHPEADDRLYYNFQGQRRRKMTRREMIDAGMTREQRHTQYKLQGGPNPRDSTI